MQHFEVLVSWARNSDVFMPPWELHMQLPLQISTSDGDDGSDTDSLLRRRKDGVLAVTWVSNCIASNNRTLLLQELMRSVPTDSFGQCLNNARLPQEMEWLGSFTSMERHVLRKENWQVIYFRLVAVHRRRSCTKCFAARDVEDAEGCKCQNCNDEALPVRVCVRKQQPAQYGH